MCGLIGGYWANLDNLPTLYQVENSLYQLRHRGPDFQDYKKFNLDNGFLLLGHTRLSIIDFSESAQQPMTSADGRYSIIFNGEIYNYIEIRCQLEKSGLIFKTKSDTEVLLAAWIVWGESSLKRLIGMFSFVVVDHYQEILFAARDGFGIKPLYYFYNGSNFIFCSEIQPLVSLSNVKPELNWQTAYDYLVHGEYDYGSATFYENIKSLPAGHFLSLKLNDIKNINIRKWWSPNIENITPISFDDAVLEFRKNFLHSTRIHLRSDVAVGAALSGGLDSSSIVCAMRYLEPDMPIHTFSFEANDARLSERKWIDIVNTHVRASSNIIKTSVNEMIHDLSDLIETQGEPFGGTSIYAQYRVFKIAKESGVTVTLDGQGADEILGGYDGFPGQRIHSLLDDGKLIDAYRFISSWSKITGSSNFEAINRTIAEYSDGKIYQILRKLYGKNPKPKWINSNLLREAGVSLIYPERHQVREVLGRRMMSKLASSIDGGGLARLLRHGDRNSMRFSVESRLPFLTLPLANFTFSLPESYLVSTQGISKSLLREAMRGIVPDKILNRTDKIGFATPEKDWLLGISSNLREWLSEDLHLPFLNQSQLLKEFDQVVKGKLPYSPQVWRWLNFCKWYENINK